MNIGVVPGEIDKNFFLHFFDIINKFLSIRRILELFVLKIGNYDRM